MYEANGHVVAAIIVAVAGFPVLQGSANSSPADELLTSGSVLSNIGGGAAPVKNATITVSWIPGLADSRPGDELPVEVVATTATTATASDGSYSGRVKPTAVMRAEAARNGGWVNFDVTTVSPSLKKAGFATVSRRLVNESWQFDTTDVAPQSLGAKVQALGSESVADDEAGYSNPATSAVTDVLIDVTSPAAPTEAIAAASGQRALAETSAAAAAATVDCTYKVDARPQRRVSVIELHNATNSDVSWSYGKKADSNVDVGFSIPGKGWKVGGSYKVANSKGAEVGGTVKDRLNAYVRTDFLWVDGHYTHPTAPNGTWCYYGPANPVYQVGSKRRDATEWVGGAGINETLPGAEYLGCDTGTRVNHRNKYSVGTYFSRYTENAAKISGAVDLGPLSVGADSGYSSNVGMAWSVKRGKGIWLCGTNAFPKTAGVVHAQNLP